jgi:hypothetical protein
MYMRVLAPFCTINTIFFEIYKMDLHLYLYFSMCTLIRFKVKYNKKETLRSITPLGEETPTLAVDS